MQRPRALRRRLGVRTFADEEDKGDAHHGGDDRDPEQWPELLTHQLVYSETDERPYDGTRCVRGPVKPEGASPIRRGRVVGDDRVAGRTSHALAHSIGHP